VGEGEAARVGEGEAARVGEGEAVGAGVSKTPEAVGAGVGSAVGSGDVRSGAVGWAVAVGRGIVGSGAVGPTVPASLGLSAAVVTVATTLMVGMAVATLVGVDASDCGIGFGWRNQSELLSFVSTVLPSGPPGLRSRLDFAGGAGATFPSTYWLAAVPHPTASITDPATLLRARAPPSAANPPEYVASAIGP
jgi:hypothetical protein